MAHGSVPPVVEQATHAEFITLHRKLRSGQQLVDPFRLFFRSQGVEELGRLLGPSKLRDAVERQNRPLHLFQGCGHQQHAALQESHDAGRDAHALGLGSLAERRDDCPPVPPNRQPHFPPERAFTGGGEVSSIRSRPPKTGGPKSSNRVDEPPVVACPSGADRYAAQVPADEALERLRALRSTRNRCASRRSAWSGRSATRRARSRARLSNPSNSISWKLANSPCRPRPSSIPAAISGASRGRKIRRTELVSGRLRCKAPPWLPFRAPEQRNGVSSRLSRRYGSSR